MRKQGWPAAALAVGGLLLTQAAAAHDDTSTHRTRTEVRMERSEFLKTHQWDEGISNWVLRPGVKEPQGIKSRAEIRSERDAFLRTNRWNATESRWEPLADKPRDLSTLSRDEMRKETQAFMKTHRWDEEKNAYVDNPPPRRK